MTSICNKLELIEGTTGWYIRIYPDTIDNIDMDNVYPDKTELPEIIWCDHGSFEFETSWLDINFEEYFEELKHKSIDIKIKIIENDKFSLNQHKEELESLKKLTYETLESTN